MAPNTREFIEAFLRGENPQKNYQQAYDLAIAAAGKVSADALERLGQARAGEAGGAGEDVSPRRLGVCVHRALLPWASRRGSRVSWRRR